MNASVTTIREGGDPECPVCAGPGPCGQHSTVSGFRWVVATGAGVKKGEAKSHDEAWAAIEAAAA